MSTPEMRCNILSLSYHRCLLYMKMKASMLLTLSHTRIEDNTFEVFFKWIKSKLQKQKPIPILFGHDKILRGVPFQANISSCPIFLRVGPILKQFPSLAPITNVADLLSGLRNCCFPAVSKFLELLSTSDNRFN